MTTDWLSAGGAIVDRLRTEMAGLRQVTTLASLSEIEAVTIQSPSAFVVWHEDAMGDTTARGAAQIVSQRWLVVVAVRSAREAGTGAGVLAEAGPLVTGVLKALMGWQPSAAHRPLARVPAPRPGFSGAFGYFPLAFETRIAFDSREAQ